MIVASHLHDGTGLDLLSASSSLARPPTLLLCEGVCVEVAREAYHHGVGYLPKPVLEADLRRFVCLVEAAHMERVADRRFFDHLARPDRLTETEWRDLEAYLRGLEVGEIARARGASPSTVQTHLKRAVSKCGYRRRSDLVRALLVERATRARAALSSGLCADHESSEGAG